MTHEEFMEAMRSTIDEHIINKLVLKRARTLKKTRTVDQFPGTYELTIVSAEARMSPRDVPLIKMQCTTRTGLPLVHNFVMRPPGSMYLAPFCDSIGDGTTIRALLKNPEILVGKKFIALVENRDDLGERVVTIKRFLKASVTLYKRST